MRVLGVDPGTVATGWGLLGGTPGRPKLIEAGVIRVGRPGEPLEQRLLHLSTEFSAILVRLRPATAAVETPFQGVDARAALQLAHARGVILANLAAAGVAVAPYSPATVKKSVTGNGRATKEQVRSMVERLLGATGGARSTDLADALAVAWCHAASRGYLERVERTPG